MVKKGCMVCGSKFSVKEYDIDRRKYCDDVKCKLERRRLAMQRYRQTDRGSAMVKVQNMRYKREEKEYECYVCKGKFMSARKRNTCDKCIESIGKKGVSNPQLSVNMRIWRSGNMDKVRAYTKSEIRSDSSLKSSAMRPGSYMA